MKFSKQTGNFYPENIRYANLPDDLIDCTDNDSISALNRAPGETLDVVNGRLVIVPIDAEQLLFDARANKSIEMRLACSIAIASGISDSSLGTTHYYPTARDDQANLNGLITASFLPDSALEYKFWCADSGGVWARRSHTKTQIAAVGKSVVDHVIAQQEKYEQKLAEIATADADGIESISW